jgi:hypothetical protein
MTKIFADYSAFLSRLDKTENGVDQDFADENSNWEVQNETNKGCWNCFRCFRCSDCFGCYDCSRCSDCSDCSYQWNLDSEKGATGTCETLEDIGFPNVPVIENIHQKIFEAASQPKALNMGDWHTCDTTHCRAGWVEFLAGDEGKALAQRTSTLFAAMQIYKKSSEIRVSPPRFYEDNTAALADTKRCAELEAASVHP